jgi:hypothetical protein
MEPLVFGMAGCCVGILTASSRVPRIRWAPYVSCVILAVATIVLTWVFEVRFLPSGLILLCTMWASASAYAGLLWKREGVDPTATYLQLVWRDLIRPDYLRALYRTSLHDHEHDTQQPTRDAR